VLTYSTGWDGIKKLNKDAENVYARDGVPWGMVKETCRQ
jgi:hypothetical protein